MRSKELLRNLDVPSQEKIMACQSPPNGHCRPPCQRILAASCSPPAPADRHQRHEERPLHGPPTVIPIPGAGGREWIKERCFFFIRRTYEPYHSPGCQGRRPHAHMHRARVTALRVALDAIGMVDGGFGGDSTACMYLGGEGVGGDDSGGAAAAAADHTYICHAIYICGRPYWLHRIDAHSPESSPRRGC